MSALQSTTITNTDTSVANYTGQIDPDVILKLGQVKNFYHSHMSNTALSSLGLMQCTNGLLSPKFFAKSMRGLKIDAL